MIFEKNYLKKHKLSEKLSGTFRRWIFTSVAVFFCLLLYSEIRNDDPQNSIINLKSKSKMKVKELIEILQELPKEASVNFQVGDGDDKY